MTLRLIILFWAATQALGGVLLSGPVRISGPVTITNVAAPVVEPTVINAHGYISFETNSVGDVATTNTVLSTLYGFTPLSVTAPNGNSGLTITNAITPFPYPVRVGGVDYPTNKSNALRYDHGASPAQYFQVRFPSDLTNVCVAFPFRTTMNGPGGGTYDLVQLQVSTGSDWISFNSKDNPPSPYVVAHTGTAGSGTQISYSPNTDYIGQVTRSNHVGYLEIFAVDLSSRLGESSHPGSSTSPVRNLQFGQFGHSALAGDHTVFGAFLINTNGDRIFRVP